MLFLSHISLPQPAKRNSSVFSQHSAALRRTSTICATLVKTSSRAFCLTTFMQPFMQPGSAWTPSYQFQIRMWVQSPAGQSNQDTLLLFCIFTRQHVPCSSTLRRQTLLNFPPTSPFSLWSCPDSHYSLWKTGNSVFLFCKSTCFNPTVTLDKLLFDRRKLSKVYYLINWLPGVFCNVMCSYWIFWQPVLL